MKHKGCQIFTGWLDEGIVYCDREVGEDGTHEGMHLYPHVHVTQPEGEDEIMEEVLKKIIASFEAQIKITETLIAEIKSTLGEIGTREGDKPKRRGKDKEPPTNTFDRAPETKPGDDKLKDASAAAAQAAAPAIAQAAGGEPVPHKEGGALQVKDVTIEMIRERSTIYSDSKNFTMDGWLALAQKVTGQKKVKDIPKEMYGPFYAAMGDELEKLVKDRAALTKPSLVAAPAAETKSATVEKPAVVGALTLDQLKAKGKEFMDKNGQPALVALVKAFGATKISEIVPEKYPAFMEALSNA